MKKTYIVGQEKFDRAIGLLDKHGAVELNNDESGKFSVKGVVGRFAKQGQNLIVVIDDKPWLASWEMIEEKMDDFFL